MNKKTASPKPARQAPVTAAHSVPPSEIKVPDGITLATIVSDNFTISIIGIGEVKMDIRGPYSIARRLGYAYGFLKQATSTSTNIACNVEQAFRLVGFDPGKHSIIAEFIPETPVMTFPTADLNFAAAVEASKHMYRTVSGSRIGTRAW